MEKAAPSLTSIMEECMNHFWRFSKEKCVVQHSIPVLYFGDHDRYLRSPIKVVTAALNPSLNEFPKSNPTQRFGYILEQSSHLSEADYRQALNDYFRVDPYSSWFQNGFEKVLAGFGASYYGGIENVPLQTDFCTPIATDPTWGNLGRRGEDPNYAVNARIKRDLQREGSRIWHNLIELLQPDIIFSCLNSTCKIEFDIIEKPQPLMDSPQTNSERVVVYSRMRLKSGKEFISVQGRTISLPFGSLSDKRKHEVGMRARALFKRYV
ncbi:hypothetical protein SAMN04487897_103333 [Paenibacillus sp. yr247]|uniref:hypothetical protein n=1 Tax=Paenibacillus sp. yr247 TaxID=1761880 RepID=UPI00088C4E3D|nr:hypothetical protein [Paenibacillus sp. yr247]SDN61050.1 hypothetical protein SAMN04487897_103333 [Paenibacillus sp. yr247]